MSRLDEVGAAHQWRCWLCDEPVDPTMSVNDPRGPSIDSVVTKAKSKTVGTQERLAHRGCNTRKGAVEPVVAWPEDLFIADAATIMTSVDRLARKGGREVMGRCLSDADGQLAANWLADRLSRLRPDQQFAVDVERGGGQYLVVLQRRG